MSASEAFLWTLVAAAIAVIVLVIVIVWDGWMEDRGWRGWRRPRGDQR